MANSPVDEAGGVVSVFSLALTIPVDREIKQLERNEEKSY